MATSSSSLEELGAILLMKYNIIFCAQLCVQMHLRPALVVDEIYPWAEFLQHFTRAFFIQKFCAKIFCACSEG